MATTNATRGKWRDLLQFDAWTALTFKKVMGSRVQPGYPSFEPTWTGYHARRLAAYNILQAYIDNSARIFIHEEAPNEASDHREYGDANLFVETILAALLGEAQSLQTEGADETGEDDGPTPDALKAQALQDWLNQWWDDERGPLKLIETERNAVGLGDGVFTMGWDPIRKRARLRCWNPGFYFPVLNDGNEDEFPSKVHIAWEEPDSAPGKIVIRRMTWELAPISPKVAATLLRRDPELYTGDEIDDLGQVTRQYAWNEERSGVTCYFTDARYTLDQSNVSTIEDLTGATADYLVDGDGEINRRDLFIDFLPVVHEPNTVAIANHFGKSSISSTLQIFDDLANADTDLQAASATTGTPPVALSNVQLKADEDLVYGPGKIFQLGPDGNMTILDTSKSLDALMKYINEGLLTRASVNARIPASVLGRIQPQHGLAGVTLALSFAPMSSMINQMRLVRFEKHPLIFKFAQRFAIAGGDETCPKDYVKTNLTLGSFLPADTDGVVKQVAALLPAKAISTSTGVRMLIEAGFPVEDAVAEVERIQSEDFAGADLLFAATGSEQAVEDYLGITVTDSNRPAPGQFDPTATPTPGQTPGGNAGNPPGQP